MKLCAKCKVESRLTYHSYCKGCHKTSVNNSVKKWGRKAEKRQRRYNSTYSQKRYQATYARIQAFKVEKGCVDCGYNAHHAGLEFDHLPGAIKLGSPTGFAGRGWNSVLREIQKCEVVCGTCHNIRTWKRSRK